MKGKSIYFFYIFFTIFLGLIFLINLGVSNSWAFDPFVFEEECDPSITRSSIDPNIVLSTPLSSLESIKIVFWGINEMNPITTSEAFHFYAGEDENTDLKENENLVIEGWTLTYTHTHSLLEEGISYTVKIDSSIATDTEGNHLDSNGNGTGGEGEVDDWVMKFIIDGNSPETGWSQIYDPENIFTENKVSSMIVDSQNWLWVGSEEGDVCYFDGNDWSCEKPFGNSDYVDDISCMTIDNEGYLWVGINILENGFMIPKLAKLVNNSWEVKDLNVSSNESIRDIAVDSKNNIWIITSKGIFQYHNGQLAIRSDNSNPLSQLITALVIDPDDNIWIRTQDSEIWQPDVANLWWGDEYTSESSYQINDISDMTTDSTGNIWVGTDNGLLKLDLSDESPNWSKYTIDNELPGNSINALIFDPKKNVIWVGTSTGLGKFYIATENGIAYTGDNASELSDKAINYLAVNSWGQVCFGAVGSGGGLQIKYEAKSPVIPPDTSETTEPVVPIPLSGSGCFLDTLQNRTKVWFQQLLEF